MTTPSGIVPLEWWGRGEEMGRAWQTFGPPDVVARALRAAELAEATDRAVRLKASSIYMRTGVQPPTEEAPEWREYLAEKKVADEDVDARLRLGTLLAFGALKRRDADPNWIAPGTWSKLHSDYYDARGIGIVYFNVRVITAEEWSLAAGQASPHLGGFELRLGHRRGDRLLGHIHASRPDQSDDLNPYRPANSRISRRILRISAVICRRRSIVSTDRRPLFPRCWLRCTFSQSEADDVSAVARITGAWFWRFPEPGAEWRKYCGEKCVLSQF